MSRVFGLITALLFALLLGVPYWLRPPEDRPPAGAVVVSILSPHPEEVRYEFGRAFAQWHRRRWPADPPVTLQWPNVGGTSDIVRFVRSEFAGSFARSYGRLAGDQWTDEAALARLEKSTDTEEKRARAAELRKARAAWLAGETSIGHDIVFGGGDFEHGALANAGYSIPVTLPDDVLAACPAALREGKPWRLAGNNLIDPESRGGRRWYGVCLSAFGIVYSPQWHSAHGHAPPRTWADLGEPIYFHRIGAADPSKSGSAMKCFEMILQAEMAAEEEAARAAVGGKLADDALIAAWERGWARGMAIIARLGGNARYLSDNSPRVPQDVALGEAAAGMAIDFYGRYQELAAGTDRIRYLHPVGGTTLSPDPISVLRGAPARKHAERFVAFCLSREGQMLWNMPPRTGPRAATNFPDGRPIPDDLPRPHRYALGRTPILPALYDDPAYAALAPDHGRPFDGARRFLEYDARRSAPLFSILKDHFLPAMLADSREELQRAWRAILDAGRPADLLEEFDHPLIGRAELEKLVRDLRAGPRSAEAAFAQRERWTLAFRAKYADLERRARGR